MHLRQCDLQMNMKFYLNTVFFHFVANYIQEL